MRRAQAHNDPDLAQNIRVLNRQCRKRGAGDLQMESVLSTLFLRSRTGHGFPKTSILDYGCGDGALLRALRTFSPQILGKIRYVAFDPEPAQVDAARIVAAEIDPGAPRTTPLVHTLAECRIGDHDEYAKKPLRENSFHIVHLVNVLHHVDPVHSLPLFLEETLSLLKVGGYLIIEDFFLGNYPSNLAWDFYTACQPEGIYWGPAELAAIFSSMTREMGPYRFFKRGYRTQDQPPQAAAAEPLCWFGFTYVLRRYAQFWGPQAFEFVRGTHYALQRLLAKAKAAARRGAPGYRAYAASLRPLLRQLANTAWVPYPHMREDERQKKMRALYDREDPFPARRLRISVG